MAVIDESPRALRARRRANGESSAEQALADSPTRVSHSPVQSKPKPGGWLPAGFAGTGPTGRFFETPDWVDSKLAAGTTPQPVNTTYLRGYLTLGFMFYSPNLVWLMFAALDYVVFPYDIPAAADFSSPAFYRFAAHRLAANLIITLGYISFWHVSLYGLGWGERKFNPAQTPARARLMHNVWFNVLGIVQWTLWESCFVHLYASGKMPYVSDQQVFSSWEGAARMIAWFFLVPLFRDLHFYFAHRLLHIRCLYKYVHSLHHRNIDIEPFAGLAMHPVEHLYYFACYTPLLYVLASPFAIMWMGMHLLLSPAASHSGWEDHFQSDQYHYLHHAKFECNYGTSGIPFDNWFGTFREKLGKSERYLGAATSDAVAKGNPEVPTQAAPTALKPVSRPDKFSFPGLPNTGMAVYYAVSAAIFGVFLVALLERSAGGSGEAVRSFSAFGVSSAQLVAALVAVGPVLAGLIGCVVSKDSFSMRWPFHKDTILGGFGFHVLVGFLFCILPTYHTVAATLGEKGDSAYCQLWGC